MECSIDKSMSNSIHDFLPKKPKERQLLLVQAKVPRELALPVRRQLRKLGISWAAFITAALKEFLDADAKTSKKTNP